MLLSSVMLSLPAWKVADPLALLDHSRKDEEDDESLESIIKNKSRPENAKKKTANADNRK